MASNNCSFAFSQSSQQVTLCQGRVNEAKFRHYFRYLIHAAVKNAQGTISIALNDFPLYFGESVQTLCPMRTTYVYPLRLTLLHKLRVAQNVGKHECGQPSGA